MARLAAPFLRRLQTVDEERRVADDDVVPGLGRKILEWGVMNGDLARPGRLCGVHARLQDIAELYINCIDVCLGAGSLGEHQCNHAGARSDIQQPAISVQDAYPTAEQNAIGAYFMRGALILQLKTFETEWFGCHWSKNNAV